MGGGRGLKRGTQATAGRAITDFFKKVSSEEEGQGDPQGGRLQAGEGSLERVTRIEDARPSADQEAGNCVAELQRREARNPFAKVKKDFTGRQNASKGLALFEYSQVPGSNPSEIPALEPRQPPQEILDTPTPQKRKLGSRSERQKASEGSTEREGRSSAWLPPEVGTPKTPGKWSPWTPKQALPSEPEQRSSSEKRRRITSANRKIELIALRASYLQPSASGSGEEPAQHDDSAPQEAACMKENLIIAQSLAPIPEGELVQRAHPGNEAEEERQSSTVFKIQDNGSSDEDEFFASIPDEIFQQLQHSNQENVPAVGQAPAGSQSSRQTMTQRPNSGAQRDAAVRFFVESVIENEGVKLLIACHQQHMYLVEVELRGAWAETNVAVGDSVNLMGDIFQDGIDYRLIIDDYNGGLIVVNPDFSLSSTCISGAVGQQCKRKSAIEAWIQGPSQGNKYMILGTMLHSLIQAGLQRKVQTGVTRGDLVEIMGHVIEEHVDGLLESDFEEKDALAAMEERIPALLRWLNTYVGPSAKQGAVLESRPHSQGSSEPICISGLVDIEDAHGGCKYGLKGRMDATVQIHRGGPTDGHQSARRKVKIAPLEFKTGQPHFTHEAQVALYNLMLEDRCESDGLESGLLWYLGKPDSMEQNSKMTQIHTIPAHTASIMQTRNTLVSCLSSVPVALPNMLHDANTCDRCFAQTACGVLHKARENGSVSTSGFGPGKFEELTHHITPGCSKFLVDWLYFLDLEENEARASDSVLTVFRKLRGNVMSLIADRQHDRLRELVINHAPPHEPIHCSQQDAADIVSSTEQLNEDQKGAVKAILSTQELCIVWGMPGAGKTLTTALAIKGLVERGQSVLVTAYTNSALDNLLLRIDALGLPFLRLGGRRENVHPTIMKHTFGEEKFPDVSFSGKKKTLQSIQVIGTTCLGAGHPSISTRTFDVCIVDEAGQVSTPAILGPLMKAKRFVLVGDFKQLSPLVKSRQAAQEGMADTLFETWANAYPKIVVPLRVQYRMAADIMSLANTLVYDGSMRCGLERVSKRRLRYRAEDATCINEFPPWIREALDPESRVRFLDVDSFVPDPSQTRRIQNAAEGRIVGRLVEGLLLLGLPAEEIGIISPYRDQVSLLRSLVASSCGGVEVSTVDKFQGREMECIIMSFVKSNDENCAGTLLEDVRRLNVAITRAKAKLLLIGSSSTLGSVPFLKSLIDFSASKGWLLRIPGERS
ncbi:hypothetical protein BSKO_01267 [Bryopsis sp. KO-2023]|nr:hypothetical protein BSKO_01267 [Bryopsis sp. KO-2023]